MSNTPSTEEEVDQAATGIADVPSEIRENDEDTLALTVKSWDQIGALKSEIVSSILAKQASMLCERFANDRPRKRLKTSSESASALTNNNTGGQEAVVSTVVTSDEGSAVDSASESPKSDESSLEDDLEADRQIDRLGRMSRLMMQLEYYHQELRNEIASIAQDVDMDN